MNLCKNSLDMNFPLSLTVFYVITVLVLSFNKVIPFKYPFQIVLIYRNNIVNSIYILDREPEVYC